MTQLILNNILKTLIQMNMTFALLYRGRDARAAHMKETRVVFRKKTNARAPDVVIKTLGRTGINGGNNPAAGPAFRL